MPASLFYTGKSISVSNSKLFSLICLCAICWIAMKTFLTETIYTCSVTLQNYFVTPLGCVTPNGIFVAPLREFLKCMRCSMILEGCNETLHNGVTELPRQVFSFSAGVSDS